MAGYWHFIIMVIGGIESGWLGALHSRGLIKWEPIWVIFVCWLGYVLDLAVPEAQWIKPELANGEHIDWIRACDWMATCPVLILFIVSMTTYGGREASVRVVPFLVANQVMFLAGITAAICAAPARWYIYGFAATCGIYVFAASAVCFRSLYSFFGDQSPRAESNGRTLVLLLACCFFTGWSIFPLAWTCGHSGSGSCDAATSSAAYLISDMLSKNLFVVLAVVLKVRYLTDNPRTLTTLVPGWKSSNNGSIALGVRGTLPLRHKPGGCPMGGAMSPATSEPQSALMKGAALLGIAPPPPPPSTGEYMPRGLKDRRPSIGNIAIDDIQRSLVPISESPVTSFRQPRTSYEGSPEMGHRALRGQSGFEFQVLGSSGAAPVGAEFMGPTQGSLAPTQMFAQMGAPAATVQAQAMQAVLQRVQELVIAHANVPSNAKHWSAVMQTAGEKMQGKASKVKEYESEVATAMQKLAEARAAMLELARAETGGARGAVTQDLEAASGWEVAVRTLTPGETPAAGPAAAPNEVVKGTQMSWLKGEEEANASTPASPLLGGGGNSFTRTPVKSPKPSNSPKSTKSPKSPKSPGRASGSPRLAAGSKLGDIRRSGGKLPPVEYTPRGRLVEDGDGADRALPSSDNQDPLFASPRTGASPRGTRAEREAMGPAPPTISTTSMPRVPLRIASRVEERVRRATLSNEAYIADEEAAVEAASGVSHPSLPHRRSFGRA